MKTCTKCKIEKPLDEYGRERAARDGRTPYCKACKKAYNAEYYIANRDHALAVAAVRRAAIPHAKWEGMYRHRARKYGLVPVVESFTTHELVARWGDECFHCKGEWSELDHHPVPVAHGGPHTLENAKPSCVTCNRSARIRRLSKTDIGETA